MFVYAMSAGRRLPFSSNLWAQKNGIKCWCRMALWLAHMFHAQERFIFRRRFWQNMMLYGSSEYFAWSSMLYCLICQTFSLMEWFESYENGKNRLGSCIQGSEILTESLALLFSKYWWDKRQSWIGCERGISKTYATTEIIEASSLFCSGFPGTCLGVNNAKGSYKQPESGMLNS